MKRFLFMRGSPDVLKKVMRGIDFFRIKHLCCRKRMAQKRAFKI